MLVYTPISLAHSYWQRLVMKGDTVIDATCGNGHDAAFLASLALAQSEGSLHLFDIQEQAIQNTKKRLSTLDSALAAQIHFHHACHTTIASCAAQESVSLIVYNLGYLPGGNKQITTHTSKTIESIQHGLRLLRPGGAMSIVCYPGHPEGVIEEKAVVQMAHQLDAKHWSVCYHQWPNRHNAPSLLLISRVEIINWRGGKTDYMQSKPNG